jgi:hypothetical protein
MISRRQNVSRPQQGDSQLAAESRRFWQVCGKNALAALFPHFCFQISAFRFPLSGFQHFSFCLPPSFF